MDNIRTLFPAIAEKAALRQLFLEPGETIEAGLVLDSGPNVRPGTSTRVTVMERYGDTVLGGSTYVLRIPAKPTRLGTGNDSALKYNGHKTAKTGSVHR